MVAGATSTVYKDRANPEHLNSDDEKPTVGDNRVPVGKHVVPMGAATLPAHLLPASCTDDFWAQGRDSAWDAHPTRAKGKSLDGSPSLRVADAATTVAAYSGFP